MRSIYEIQKDIAEASHRLNNLILEKKLTINVIMGIEESSKILAEQAIEKMMTDERK
jgi:hypothetical protein